LAQSKPVAEGLLSFKMEQGSFPCQATRKLLEDDGIDFLPSGTSADGYIAQLVATDNIDSEKIFTLPGLFPPKMRDCLRYTGSLLDPGENSFAYIMAPDEKPLTYSKNDTPIILVAIAEEGQKEPIFNHRIYGNKFVVGLVDGSSTAGDLDENGHAVSEARESFFQTGPDSLFGKDTPVLKYPLRLE
jgi:hypothetical protein